MRRLPASPADRRHTSGGSFDKQERFVMTLSNGRKYAIEEGITDSGPSIRVSDLSGAPIEAIRPGKHAFLSVLHVITGF